MPFVQLFVLYIGIRLNRALWRKNMYTYVCVYNVLYVVKSSKQTYYFAYLYKLYVYTYYDLKIPNLFSNLKPFVCIKCNLAFRHALHCRKQGGFKMMI